jgi:hypothetical protein
MFGSLFHSYFRAVSRTQPKKSSKKPSMPPHRSLEIEILEGRLAPTIDLNVVQGGTLDVNPVSSIFPSASFARMDVLTTTVPGLNHGTMFRVTLTDAIIWGSGPPNPFEPAMSPSFNQNRIFAGEGFRYVNDGTGLGQTDSVPVRFSNTTGSMTQTDTLVIHINSAANAPTITQQPEGITIIGSGQTATLHVVATGTPVLHFQWFSGITPNTSNPIAGATSDTFTTPVLTTGGQYLFWVQVSNSAGVANSLNATVQVNESTTTTSQSLTATYSMASQGLPWHATVTRTAPELFGIPNGGVTYDVPNVGTSGNTVNVANGPGVAIVGGTFTIPGHTHAGIYPATVSYAGSIVLFLSPSADTSRTLTILKADQTITGFGPLAPKTYGDADFSIGAGVSATSGQEAGGVMFASSNPSVAVVTGSTVHIVGAGTTQIIASQPGNGDWNPAPNVPQTLIVNTARLSVTANGTQVYGQSTRNIMLDFTGFVSGDNASVLGGTVTFDTPATSASPVGSYPITPAGLTSTNYTITFVTGTLNVTPAALSITANNANKNEGDAFTFAGTEFTTSGLVNGDMVNSVTLFSFGAAPDAEEGSYDIAPSMAVGTGLSNYNIAFFSGVLLVHEPPLVASATALDPVDEGGATGGRPLVVATFTHANGVEPADRFTANTDWGVDGHHADPGLIFQDGTGTYQVANVRPIFAEDGTYMITVTITEDNNSATVNEMQVITEPALVGAGASLAPVNAGDPSASVEIATFLHANGVEPAGDFAASVDWGIDGHHADSASITQAGDGTYHVSASRPVFDTPGTYVVSVSISEDNVTALVIDSQVVNSVGPTPTTTTLDSSNNPSAISQAVTFTATVTPSFGSITPDGMVTFTEGAATLGSAALSGGQATFTTSSLAVGVHTIIAAYDGSGSFTGSISNAVDQTVKADSTTIIAGSPNPSNTGQTVTFTIAVSSNVPGLGTPSGTVLVTTQTSTLGTFTLDGAGHATFMSTLPDGPISVTATYGGDSTFLSSAGNMVQKVGSKLRSTIRVASDQNPSTFGTAVTFTATVTGSGVTPMGTATFIDSKITLATVPLDSSGVATLTTSSLSVGRHNVFARYSGGTNYNSSSSNVVTQVVTASTNSTLVASQATARTESGQELAGWQRLFQTGGARDQREQLFLTSFELDLKTVDGYYMDLLHRAGNSSSRLAWANLLSSGGGTLEPALSCTKKETTHATHSDTET